MMIRMMAVLMALGAPMATDAAPYEPRTLSAQTNDLAAGRTTSVRLVRDYLKRIEAMNRKGPELRAVIAINPDALAEAKRRDAERRAGKMLGPLHGVPILIKDNIETADNMPTTAGSLALKDNFTRRDAPLVGRLRAAGAIILGKSSLSEWANIRGFRSTSGWSAVGGVTRNPHVLDRNPCGSSSGSGAGVAAGLAAGAVGTETDGSITCPAAINGVVGFKPSVGLVSRSLVVPISHSQDTAGPMTLSVRDAALMLSVMAGSDPADPATAEADVRKADYMAALSPDALKGKRIGVLRLPGTNAQLFDAAMKRLEAAGATLVPLTPDLEAGAEMGPAEFVVLQTELKAGMDAYLSGLPGKIPHKSLADIIAFNKANAAAELPWFQQEIFVAAQATKGLDDPAYKEARAKSLRLAGPELIDRLMKENRVTLLIAQTNSRAWKTRLLGGDNFSPPSISRPPAIAGYPHLTVPMGMADGLPLGLSFVGAKWADAEVLAAGHAFEVAGSPLRAAPKFVATLPEDGAAKQ